MVGYVFVAAVFVVFIVFVQPFICFWYQLQYRDLNEFTTFQHFIGLTEYTQYWSWSSRFLFPFFCSWFWLYGVRMYNYNFKSTNVNWNGAPYLFNFIFFPFSIMWNIKLCDVNRAFCSQLWRIKSSHEISMRKRRC